MNNLNSIFKQGESVNIWKYFNLTAIPVKVNYDTMDGEINLTEGYQEVEYPVRREFMKKINTINPPNYMNLGSIYYGFENPRVDFSTFLTTPHHVKAFLINEFYSELNTSYEFEITTCGRVCIWINGELKLDFRPYTRNHGSKTKVNLELQKGMNEILVYFDDLAERDVNFFFELKLLSNDTIEVCTPIDYSVDVLNNKINFLESLYFEKDIFEEGEIVIKADDDSEEIVYIDYNNDVFSDGVGGNITDFDRKNEIKKVKNKQILLGNVATYLSSGLTHVKVGVKLPDGQILYKKLTFTVVNLKKMDMELGRTIEERKKQALKIFSNLKLNDVNVAISSLYLGKPYKSIVDKMEPAYQMIKNKGDCADFMFAPLLSYAYKNYDNLDWELKNKIKSLALSFRYWIDEPGNDVMWYFSENHALLFHICQYFAGLLFENEKFLNSGRKGSHQYELGKKRLLSWFETFNSYGFSEWNSATYIPIDLIGFFSLYYSAPDEEIKVLARKALDYTFEILAVSNHGPSVSNTFGRTYEHDLKAMKIGEISNILKVTWNRGIFNYALRATTMFCLTDYEPPKELIQYIDLEPSEYLQANYIQGVNKVQTYLFKSNDYSLATAIEYNMNQPGHQQHYINISLGKDGTQLWINNPGELAHSGEGRPSYWAGNGICPKSNQKYNLAKLEYNLKKADIKMIHLYLPFWSLDEVITKEKNWLFIRKSTTYLAIYFSEGYNIVNEGDTRNREVQSWGENHTIIIKCSSKNEGWPFAEFVQTYKIIMPESQEIIDPQIGNISQSVWNKSSLELDYKPEIKRFEGKKEGEKIGFFKKK